MYDSPKKMMSRETIENRDERNAKEQRFLEMMLVCKYHVDIILYSTYRYI